MDSGHENSKFRQFNHRPSDPVHQSDINSGAAYEAQKLRSVMETVSAIKKRLFILISLTCYLVFCHLMITKLNALGIQSVEPGATPGTTSLRTSFAEDGCSEDCGPSWAVVFAPLWVSDVLILVTHAMLCRMGLEWTPTSSERNAQIEHIVGCCRSVLYAAFKILLLRRLEAPLDASAECAPGLGPSSQWESCSWFAVFSPTYAAALVQIGFHLHKHLEPSPGRSRNAPRRPGFPVNLLDLLALNISCQLEGVFYIPDVSWASRWASVLWPLWIVAAMGAIAIFAGLCFAIPLLRRRVPASQLPCVLPPLVLLVAAYIFGLQGLTALTARLNGDETISVASIMVPITSAVWALTLLLTVVVISSFCNQTIATGNPQEPVRLLSADMLPRLLVMESSTLFRQVSSRTLERYERLNEDDAGGRGRVDEATDARANREASCSSGASAGTELQEGAPSSSLKDLEANPKPSAECWVCFEGDAEAVLLHCGHAGLCLSCAENLWRTRAPCPMCREPIEVIARIGEAVTVDGKVLVAPQLPTTTESPERKR